MFILSGLTLGLFTPHVVASASMASGDASAIVEQTRHDNPIEQDDITLSRDPEREADRKAALFEQPGFIFLFV